MQFSEKELEDFIFSDLVDMNGETMTERDFVLLSSSLINQGDVTKIKWFRQLNLGAYGICDVVGFYRYEGSLHVELMELKIVPLKSEDFNQLLRYKEAIRTFFKRERPCIHLTFHCYLVGPSIETGHYIHNNSDIVVAEYEFDLSGLHFTKHGPYASWCMSDPNFILIKSSSNGQKVY